MASRTPTDTWPREFNTSPLHLSLCFYNSVLLLLLIIIITIMGCIILSVYKIHLSA